MKSEINVKELVEIATKGTRKLKYLEWDYISIKYRYLPNNFLIRINIFLLRCHFHYISVLTI